MVENQDSKDTYVQLSKPYFTLDEISVIEKHNPDLLQNIRNCKLKFKETFQIIINLCVKLNIPIKILQNTSYFYQKFYLLNNNYKKYSNLHFEIGIASLFMALKMNDYIKKINVVLTEAYQLKGMHLSSTDIDENKKIVVSLERKILEFQSFDFRNFLSEEFLIRYLKSFNNDEQQKQKQKQWKKNFSYLSWSVLNDLYLTPLVLQFPAHYNAIASIKCLNLILNELWEEKLIAIAEEEKVVFDDKELIHSRNNTAILSGCNQLLEYYIDNLSTTFLQKSLSELGYEIETKKLIDLLINIKIEVNNKINKDAKIDKLSIESDLFFQPRNTEIAKNGSIRFVYNKERFIDEVKLYK